MSKHTPAFMLGALIEGCGLVTLFLVARKSDGGFSPPVVGFAVFLIICGTAVAIQTALRMAADKKQR